MVDQHRNVAKELNAAKVRQIAVSGILSVIGNNVKKTIRNAVISAQDHATCFKEGLIFVDLWLVFFTKRKKCTGRMECTCQTEELTF